MAKKYKLDVNHLEDDLIIIRGDKEHLLKLANFILNLAVDDEEDKVQMGPHYAGSALFTKKSKYGLYIYKENNKFYPPGE